MLLRPRPRPVATAPPAPRHRGSAGGRRPFLLAVALLLVASLGLRLWSIDHGLPYLFNPDEELHFVSRAVGMLRTGSLNPGYFENPPALTYLLWGLFKVVFTAGFPFGGGAAFARDVAADPQPAFLLARVIVALLGTLVVGLVVWAGDRLYDRRVGLVAGAIMAAAFLPVFYSKQALNDVVTLIPVTLALIACLVVMHRGRPHDYVIAGVVLGACCATKYTAGAMVIVLLAAAGIRLIDRRSHLLPTLGRLVAAGAAFTVTFLVLHPYALLDFDRFSGALGNQSNLAGEVVKLGQADVPPPLYYLWTLTWGLGWAPLVAAIAGAVVAFRLDARRAALLVAFPVLLLLFLGIQARYFGRWYLPAYPMLAILAGLAAVRLTERVARRTSWRPAVLAAFTGLLVLQGLVSDVRVSALLGERDTRALTRTWLVENVPPGSRLALEPFLPAGFLGTKAGSRRSPDRYATFPVERPFQEYEFRVGPALVDQYRAQGYCWVVTSSYQRQRGLQAGLPNARGYYQRLDEASDRVAAFSPYRFDADAVPFNFDLSYNFLPTAYARPGPVVEVLRLRGCPA